MPDDDDPHSITTQPTNTNNEGDGGDNSQRNGSDDVDLEQRGSRSSPHCTLSAVCYDDVVRVLHVHLLKGKWRLGCG